MSSSSEHSLSRHSDSKSQGEEDLEHDKTVGFQLISGDDIDDLGIPEIIRLIRKRIGDSPVYLRFVHRQNLLMQT